MLTILAFSFVELLAALHLGPSRDVNIPIYPMERAPIHVKAKPAASLPVQPFATLPVQPFASLPVQPFAHKAPIEHRAVNIPIYPM